jgi:formamidopyrimidine-DNA glycosylase
MPELPDIMVYVEALEKRLVGQSLEKARLKSPFLVRTVEPPLLAVEAKRIVAVKRLGKRIVFAFEDELYLVLHLMISGRLHWKDKGTGLPGKIGLGAFEFPNGTLVLTESGTKRRASLHVVRGEKALAEHNPGGLEVLDADLAAFQGRLQREVHTLKRALTDPRLFSGIGNSYSDEILHRARLSPMARTDQLPAEKVRGLWEATQTVLQEWTQRLRAEAGEDFPENVTAFRPEMAVHGRFRQPCPVCGTTVQRIVYAENECNYCPKCQTSGKVLADRSLSRLLHKDWPRTMEEWEGMFEVGASP